MTFSEMARESNESSRGDMILVVELFACAVLALVGLWAAFA